MADDDDDEVLLNVIRCQLTYQGEAETNAEARFNIALRPRKPEGSLGRGAQDGHLDFHTAPELCEETGQTAELMTTVILMFGGCDWSFQPVLSSLCEHAHFSVYKIRWVTIFRGSVRPEIYSVAG